MNNDIPNDTAQVATPATSATPEPLWKKGASMADYPLSALGVLEEPVRACAKLSNAHIATCAQSALAVVSLATQGLADILHPNGSKLPISLFFLTIAESGDGKTACDRFMMAPIKEREKEMYIDYVKLKESAEEGSHPQLPILVCEEPTFEGLYNVLQNGCPSQGVFSDEGGQFVGGHGMSQDARLRTFTGLSRLWDGSPLKRARASTASALFGRRLSLHLMLQPKVAGSLFADGLSKSQGFTSRCLIASPPSMAGQRFYKEYHQEVGKALQTYNERLLEILRQPLNCDAGSSLRPRYLKLTKQQKEIWVSFQHEVEARRGIGRLYNPIKEFSAKAAEHVLRLGAVLSLLENGQAETLDDRALENAVVLTRFYLAEALRLETQEVAPPEIVNAIKLLGWLEGREQKHFVLRDICNAGPNSIRKKDDAEEALAILVAKRWVIAPSAKGGPYRMYNA